MQLTPKYTLVCDDIRQENTGKFIVIGLYMGNITVPHVPFVLPSLAFLQIFESDNAGNFSFKIRLEQMEKGNAIVEGMGMIAIQGPGTGVIPIRFAPLQLPAFGTYTLTMSIDGQAPLVLSTFDVIQQPPQQQPGFRPL